MINHSSHLISTAKSSKTRVAGIVTCKIRMALEWRGEWHTECLCQNLQRHEMLLLIVFIRREDTNRHSVVYTLIQCTRPLVFFIAHEYWIMTGRKWNANGLWGGNKPQPFIMFLVALLMGTDVGCEMKWHSVRAKVVDRVTSHHQLERICKRKRSHQWTWIMQTIVAFTVNGEAFEGRYIISLEVHELKHFIFSFIFGCFDRHHAEYIYSHECWSHGHKVYVSGRWLRRVHGQRPSQESGW